MCIRASIVNQTFTKFEVKSASSRFQPGEGPSMGFLRDFTLYNIKLCEGSLAALMCTRLSGGGPAPLPQTPRTGFSRLIGGEN